MTVIEANVGEKIPYVVRRSKITFDDELMLNLAKLERDDPISVDICMTKLGMLTTGLGRDYVAQIAIPAREYTETEMENPDYDAEDPTSREKITQRDPVPFSMTNVTLTLYAL